MLVRVIKKRVAYLGKLGDERDIPDGQARLHIKLGNAEPANKKPRRVYRRRDMTAESVVSVEVVSEPTE